MTIMRDSGVSTEWYVLAPLECSRELWYETILKRSPIKNLIKCLKLEKLRSTF